MLCWRDAMIPWTKLGGAALPDGTNMALLRKEEVFSIEVDNLVLMHSRSHHSEEQLAVLGCGHCVGQKNQRILVGGLGMGFTLRAALDTVDGDAEVTVAELVPEVVAWNRGVLAHLAANPLADPRTRVLVGDVAGAIETGVDTYDAILLDVDNGPVGFTADCNNRLYNKAGLARIFRALRHRGVLALWSCGDDGLFTARLRQMGFYTTKRRVRARERTGPAHMLWLAMKTTEHMSTPSRAPERAAR